jgi:hypothetical protein
MSADNQIPPNRDLPPGRLAQRREHLLAEIARAPERRRRPWRAAVPALAAALAVAILLLVAPWQAPSLTDRALAALGGDAVLHVVTTQPHGPVGARVDIETGRAVPIVQQSEIWFDAERGLKRTVTRLDGVLDNEMLETPAGGFTQAGPVITCAWIAAHPVEATRRRVSCNENMENGTTPRKIPEPLPTLDPALSGFADGYRAALASGEAKEIGRDTIDGNELIWLRFTYKPSQRPAYTQEVAVDASTYRPVRLRNPDHGWTVDVTAAETVPYDASLFPMPAKAPPGPSIGRARGDIPLELSEVSSVLGRSPLWLGREWQGLRLIDVSSVAIVTGYPRGSGREPTHTSGVRLTYVPNGGPTDGPKLEITQTTSCAFALRWSCGPRDPGPGELSDWFGAGSRFSIALARRHGLYLSIWNDLGEPETLAVVRALAPLP